MDLTLHLGAHRTGSTAISDAFWQSADAVKDMGTGFRRPNRLRKIPYFEHVERLTDVAAQGDMVARNALASVAEALHKDMRQAERLGRRHMVYSEENILGFMEENLGKGTLYPFVKKRLDAYVRIFPARPTRIGIGLRSYDTLWVSAYSYTLSQRPWPTFGEMKGRLVANRRGWADVVGDIRAFFPGAEIFLWRQEDLGEVFREVVTRLGQIADPSRLTLPEAPVNTSISAAEVPLVHLLRQAEPGLRTDALKQRMDAFTGDRPPPEPGFSAPERTALRQRYDNDVATLAGQGFDFIRPAVPAAGGPPRKDRA
jgi:hypothetical protein